jgi:carbamoyltransferase
LTAILGISAFYHDSAAALIVDGHIVAAAQEERFTRRKHDARFPTQAIAYCLREAGISGPDLNYVAYYEKPFTKFERLLETYLAFAPRGFRSFCLAMSIWLKDKLHLRRTLRKALPAGTTAPLLFLDHHQSHAASAFFPSPYSEAAILTLDGVGEWSTTAWGIGRGNELQLLEHLSFPHSIGLLYSAFTTYCGFKVNSGEYKLMGLAPYGRPIYSEAILEHLIDLKPDGSFRLNMRYFNYCSGLTMTNRRFHQLFGGSPRLPDSRLEQRHMDLAASIQVVTETLILNIARHVQERTGLRNLVLAGGVALNCVANGRLLREGPFESIWVQPAAGDAGGALGAALFTWFQLLKNTRSPVQPDAQQGSLLGPAFTGSDIAELLASKGITAPRLTREVLVRQVAGLLAREAVVGWFQGRMEFGPRALGNRSILGDPRSARMQSIMNLKIKFRESFRPFAPSVLAEAAGEWFDLPRGHDSPYMLLVAPILSVHRFKLTPEQLEIFTSHPDLNVRLDIPHSVLPAITHIDSSARVQTVDRERNPLFHDLLAAFQAQTGCPVLVNTSFNIRGEPIVCRPEEALNGFLATDLDVLVLGDHVIQKADVAHLKPPDRVKYSSQFERD